MGNSDEPRAKLQLTTGVGVKVKTIGFSEYDKFRAAQPVAQRMQWKQGDRRLRQGQRLGFEGIIVDCGALADPIVRLLTTVLPKKLS